ncbi:hypothetical protein THASP1DRAFT_23800 [Thamnocephalis sphaerospora]|uniref:Uncharacterized protein n=1 Tax=Thamnocephalis sphaerospora TaxID=78915 RepID=A0A4P9XQ49_9FUNG|nr:hypothetical protein THASP1DRAFT_23800 [Thamnocephalis sphaerospora]|eukprot:RKP08153.1 hypothetical protein THASP1DRAFT_23800 [Thamnocephalis sphaerospora]
MRASSVVPTAHPHATAFRLIHSASGNHESGEYAVLGEIGSLHCNMTSSEWDACDSRKRSALEHCSVVRSCSKERDRLLENENGRVSKRQRFSQPPRPAVTGALNASACSSLAKARAGDVDSVNVSAMEEDLPEASMWSLSGSSSCYTENMTSAVHLRTKHALSPTLASHCAPTVYFGRTSYAPTATTGFPSGARDSGKIVASKEEASQQQQELQMPSLLGSALPSKWQAAARPPLAQPPASTTSSLPRRSLSQFSMGYRRDCPQCLARLPGHYAHLQQNAS